MYEMRKEVPEIYYGELRMSSFYTAILRGVTGGATHTFDRGK